MRRFTMRQQRLKAALIRLGAAANDRLHHAMRPLDTDDKDAARALAAALLVAVRDGITDEESAALKELAQAFVEARSNTP